MRRFFIPHTEIQKLSPKICGQDARHIKRVLRLRPGNRIVLLDGSGYEYEASITGLSDDSVSIEILHRYIPETESPLQMVVIQGILKEKKMDLLVRHLTEIGISKWQPVFTKHSIPRPDKKRMASRIKRWNTIAKEAIKQCRRTKTPEMAMPLTLEQALCTEDDADLKFLFWENETVGLQKATAPRPGSVAKIIILLGPEGGFSESEVELAKSAGFISVSLGPRILKAETAALSACTLVQYLYGDMGEKNLDSIGGISY